MPPTTLVRAQKMVYTDVYNRLAVYTGDATMVRSGTPALPNAPRSRLSA